MWDYKLSKTLQQVKVLKSYIGIAKNYLIEKEIKEQERIVYMYLDYAENQAARQLPMKMAGWNQKLDAFLQFVGDQTLFKLVYKGFD
ncbi:RhuM family protein [Chitinophaga sp. LS1]|uniref:RhuM family protein n=1 Tax=Chitinophaga sp. LS1 TaxID=3051176 RepID=UPI002AAA6F8A|nr:RhuM family protein [Chitinophaga sp. LS1]WPV70625.1 RhuM family protein [Chitinophaga sp. LS1]